MSVDLRSFVDSRTAEGNFITPSEYIQHLIRQDQERTSTQRFEKQLLAALDSNDFEEVSPEFFEKFRERACHVIAQKSE